MAEQDLPIGGVAGMADAIAAAHVEQLYDPEKLTRVQKVIKNAVAEGYVIGRGASAKGEQDVFDWAAEGYDVLEDAAARVFGPILARLISHMLGIEVPASALREANPLTGESSVGKAVARTVMTPLRAPEGELEPGDANAVKMLGSLGHLALQSWMEGVIIEIASSVFPKLEHIEKFAEVGKDLISAIGLDELGRIGLRPLANITIATPLSWHANRVYRPSLLTPAQALRQFTRGRWDWADVEEELARQGYTSERIAALSNEQQKFATIADAQTLLYRGEWTQDRALQELRDQGYDEDAAQRELRVEGLKRIASLEASLASSLVTAYAARDIDRGEFEAQVDAAIGPPPERAFTKLLGEQRRALNVKHLSSTQAAACVKVGILAVADYRRALEREGYTPDAVVALELLLRHELDEKVQIDKLRADLNAQRAAEKAAADAARKQRAADVEAATALHRRGQIADLRAAVVRGLIPISRLEEVLAASYDADTVAIYVGLVQDDRQTFLDQQAKAAAAAQRAAHKGLSVPQLETAVLEGVLTIDAYRTSLKHAGLDDADIGVLAATLAAKVKAINDARAKRRAADQAAASKSIDLGRFEQLVRRGHRTIAEYRELVASLGFDDAAIAGMVELLELRIADDQAARDVRDTTGHAPTAAGLTLEQARRAVILGTWTIDQFQTFLVNAGYTVDAQTVLVAELRDAVVAAEDARRRRQQTADVNVGTALPLSRLLTAARLGIIPPAEYQRRLEQAGYSSDDVAIEMDLLLTEISQVQAARATQAATEGGTVDRGLSLAQLARAVKLGVRSIDDYRARAVAVGLNAEDVATVVGVLEQELLVLSDAKNRRTQIAADLVVRGVALGDLEEQVVAGTMTVGAYQASLEELGVDPDDADYLAALLVVQLDGATADSP